MIDEWGIVAGYHDGRGRWRETSEETRLALRRSMGYDPDQPSPVEQARIRVVRAGESVALDAPAELTLEDGTRLRVERALPPDLPLGYHDLASLSGGPIERLIVTPGRCHFPEELRTWGWAAQLYALRSRESWGIGDLADLRRLSRWSSELGAGLILLNPLSAPTPLSPQQASPYYPSSRRFRNPLYLRIEEVPGARDARLDLEPIAAEGRALNQERKIDRDKVFNLKMSALERLWKRFTADESFDRYCREHGEPLAQFGRYCALAEHHRSGWRQWPAEYHRPDSTAVLRFADKYADRVRFHLWLQWLLDEQMARAASGTPLMQDLPIGVDPNGADAWVWQELMASNMSVGSPADDFNERGQNWGIPPFVPHKLRAAGYAPFIQTIRGLLRHSGGLRIDHVMGLFRLYWIPDNADATAGTYVRYRPEELLAIVAIESHRARAIVVGEDLGTVEPGVREVLAEHQILSYRLLLFGPEHPSEYPRLSMAAITTHDLPTIAGLWSGADLKVQRQLGLDNEEATQEILSRLRELMGLTEAASIEEVIPAIHRLLSGAGSSVVTATLEDALGVEERPNIPGTLNEWPNWSLALPQTLESIEADPLVRAVASVLSRRS